MANIFNHKHLIHKFVRHGIYNSIKQIYYHSKRSPHRIKYIHYWIRNYVQNRLGSNYKCYSYNPRSIADDKEMKVDGKFYPKNSDITIVNNNGKILGVLSVKFILSNYKQNSNNYFESMIGECYNMKANNIRYGHIMICPLNIPYYDIDSKLKKVERLNSNDIGKYVALNDAKIEYKPDILSFNIVNINTEDKILPNPDLVKKMDDSKREKIVYSIKNSCELLYNHKIDTHFDTITSNYLKNNSIIKSLNNYMDTIEKDNAIYGITHSKTYDKNGNNNDNILDTNRAIGTKKNDSFINRIFKKFKK
jgi:hypothetical protein